MAGRGCVGGWGQNRQEEAQGLLWVTHVALWWLCF